jgi:TPR repeat protein
MFEQLNRIEAKVRDIHVFDLPGTIAGIEQETELWWEGERRVEAGRPKGIWPWSPRPKCGPWCHRDWNIKGISRLDEIEYERTHPHQETEESKKEEFDQIKRLADSGFLREQCDLGRFYELGWGVAKDQSEALRWYRRAAERGDRNAQYRLATAYFDGNGVPADNATAYFWLKLRQMHDGLEGVGDLLSPEQRTEVEQRCREWMESHRPVNAAE